MLVFLIDQDLEMISVYSETVTGIIKKLFSIASIFVTFLLFEQRILLALWLI